MPRRWGWFCTAARRLPCDWGTGSRLTVGEPEFTNDGVLLVASLDDLMATKLKVILQRPEAKDYRDIAATLETQVRLDRGLMARLVQRALLAGTVFHAVSMSATISSQRTS